MLFDGLSEQQILNLPQEEVENLILLGEPLVFRAGSVVLLGSFKIAGDHLVIELAQIEGGGEGVLVSLASLATRYARLRKLSGIEWIVHAVTCAKPNLKLRRVLEPRALFEQCLGESFLIAAVEPFEGVPFPLADFSSTVAVNHPTAQSRRMRRALHAASQV